ncbi:MAG TPA: hypothetical protein VER55_16890, partial [Ardenticatenaceae bacterium]|nr:hypothetical protein [Ardenticatenaceae bacterium]
RALYRITGTSRDGGETLDWSVVLKVYGSPQGSTADPGDPFYWKREALAYDSALLRDLPGGFIAPETWGVVEQPDGQLWLWLEEVRETGEALWPPARYALAASHLGHMGASFLVERDLTNVPWLGRSHVRPALAGMAGLVDLVRRAEVWEHPLLRNAFPAPLVSQALRLWDEREPLLAALEDLPRTLCHHDVWRRNLFARTRAGREETVAIDWELVGSGAPGEDAGNLMGVSLLNLDIEAGQSEELAEAILSGYLEGLQAGGWRGDPAAVRFAFATTAALRCLFSTVGWPAAIVLDQSGRHVVETEQRWGRPIEEVFAHWGRVAAFLLDQADGARAWLAGSRHARSSSEPHSLGSSSSRSDVT